MTDDIYMRLARHLDNLPGGFPPTATGVELRILRRLFTPEEAEMAVFLTVIPEEVRIIARRGGTGDRETGKLLATMTEKGLIFSIERKNHPTLYMASQYIIGIWEYHVNDLDRDLIRDMNEYLPTVTEIWYKAPQLRTVPVNRSINAPMETLSYERAEDLVKSRKKFLVAPCICRKEHIVAGEGCDKPVETCLIFGLAADYYDRRGVGRIIDLQETLAILQKADEAGLVLQPSNAQRIVNICCCCGCCCQILKHLKRHPRPATVTSTPFIAVADTELCTGCNVCYGRCQMDAITLVSDKVSLDADRCIGCGLCVSKCPGGALSLKRKPEVEQRRIPGNMTETLRNISIIRRKPDK